MIRRLVMSANNKAVQVFLVLNDAQTQVDGVVFAGRAGRATRVTVGDGRRTFDESFAARAQPEDTERTLPLPLDRMATLRVDLTP